MPDEQIDQDLTEIHQRIQLLLDSWGYVSPEMLSEYPGDQARRFIRDFFEAKKTSQPIILQGDSVVKPAAEAATAAPPASSASTDPSSVSPQKAPIVVDPAPPQPGASDSAKSESAAGTLASPPPGTVTIESEPSGARVVLDGSDCGVTPITLSALSAGSHKLELSAPDHKEHVQIVDLDAKSGQKLLLTLEPLPASLEITTVPDGGQISVDGIIKGAAPLTIEGLDVGVHSVRASLGGYFPQEEIVRLFPNRSKSCDIVLRKAATLSIESNPLGARVSIDGEYAGETPLVLPTLAPGRRSLATSLAGHVTVHQEVDLKEGEKRDLSVDLETNRSALWRKAKRPLQALAALTLVLALIFGLLEYNKSLARDRFVREGLASIEQLRFDEAANTFQDALDLYPRDEKARAGLRRAMHLNAVDADYESGLLSFKSKEYRSAVDSFASVQKAEPGFRDTSVRLKEAKSKLSYQRKQAALAADYRKGMAEMKVRLFGDAHFYFSEVAKSDPTYKNVAKWLPYTKKMAAKRPMVKVWSPDTKRVVRPGSIVTVYVRTRNAEIGADDYACGSWPDVDGYDVEWQNFFCTDDVVKSPKEAAAGLIKYRIRLTDASVRQVGKDDRARVAREAGNISNMRYRLSFGLTASGVWKGSDWETDAKPIWLRYDAR